MSTLKINGNKVKKTIDEMYIGKRKFNWSRFLNWCAIVWFSFATLFSMWSLNALAAGGWACCIILTLTIINTNK